MTEKEKLEKLKKLADAMYYAAQYLTTDASRLHKAMDEYHKFIIHEWKEEPVSEELEEASKNYALNNTPWDDCKDEIQESFKVGAKWQKEQMMAKAINAQCFGFQGAALFSFRLPADNYLVGSEVKIIVIKED